jgi:hypothetical protein
MPGSFDRLHKFIYLTINKKFYEELYTSMFNHFTFK